MSHSGDGEELEVDTGDSDRAGTPELDDAAPMTLALSNARRGGCSGGAGCRGCSGACLCNGGGYPGGAGRNSGGRGDGGGCCHPRGGRGGDCNLTRTPELLVGDGCRDLLRGFRGIGGGGGSTDKESTSDSR